MKGRGKSARMAAVAAPRSSASGGAGAGAGADAGTEAGSATTTSASAVDPAPVAPEEESVATTAPAAAVSVDDPAERDQELMVAQAALAREDELPMDETEYADEVDNEFVRGRMQNVVRVATGNDIQITFGDGFHTDMSGGVQLDPNDPDKEASPEDRIVMMQGGLEHEICHELYYDNSAFEEMKSQMEADPSRVPVAFINNILADGHDEWRHKLARPEAYGLIEAHDELFVKHNGSGRWSFDPDKQDTWTQVTGAMLYRGLPYYRVPEDKLSDEARAAYHDVAPNVDAAIKGTSHDCLAQANEIYDKLKSRGLIPEKPEQDHLGGGAGPGAEGSPGMGGSSGSSGSSGGSGEGSQGGSQGGEGTEDGELGGDDADAYDASVSGSGGQGGQPAGKQNDGSQEGASSRSEGSDAGGGSGGSQSASQDTGEGSAVTGGDVGEDGGPGEGGGPGSSKAGSPGGSGGGNAKGKADSKGNDFVANPGASEEELESRRRQAKSLANTAASKKPQGSQRANSEEQVARPVDALSEFRGRWQKNRRLAHEFAAQIKQAQTETTAPKKRQSSGRLDRGRRRALAAGDEKVFVKRGREREVDMSVELLLDVSGSMSESIDGLKDSSSVISRGLDEAKIDHEVRGFSSGDTMPLYRAFGEKADWKLGSMQARGSTDMGGGIEKLREGFSARTEKQKLGVVLADGRPNEDQSVRDQIAAARREGITPFGIFLRAEPDTSYLPSNVSDRERQRHIESEKRAQQQGEEKMRELFGGNVAVLDDVGQLPKVAGKKIVELMRRQS